MRRIPTDSSLDIRISRRMQEEKKIAVLLAANPQIGVLQRGRKKRYYLLSPYREAKHPADLLPMEY